jgi:hypothetical protein
VPRWRATPNPPGTGEHPPPRSSPARAVVPARPSVPRPSPHPATIGGRALPHHLPDQFAGMSSLFCSLRSFGCGSGSGGTSADGFPDRPAVSACALPCSDLAGRAFFQGAGHGFTRTKPEFARVCRGIPRLAEPARGSGVHRPLMGGGGFGNGAPKQWRRVWSCDCARGRRRRGEAQPWNDAGAPGTGGPGLGGAGPDKRSGARFPRR